METSSSLNLNFDPLIPFNKDLVGVENVANELRSIRERTGFRRFLITGPGFNAVMYGPFADDVYSKIGDDIARIQSELKDTDIKLSWWCAPTIRYFSDFNSIEDAAGNKCVDNKKCPLDESFIKDWTAKIRSVAERCDLEFIVIEDDFVINFSRGLNESGGCYCHRHLELFAKLYGEHLTAEQIWDAFVNRTPENLPIRRAFADAQRESLVALAKRVRSEVNKVNSKIRIVLCEPGGADLDGDSAEAITRAFAGENRPAIRQQGAIYSAETTPAMIPSALCHAMWVTERLPRDIETFYEADTYPHNRFFSSATAMTSLMSGVLMAGSSDFMFYCTQYLDDPLEDDGYAAQYKKLLPKFEKAHRFIMEKEARLTGIRQVWSSDAAWLNRRAKNLDGDHWQSLIHWQSYFYSKMGLPYTMRDCDAAVNSLIGGMPDYLSDEEIRRMLSGGLFIDAQAAEILAKRGFSKEIGADVERVERIPALGEKILPAAECLSRGKRMNASFIFNAGAEGSIRRYAVLKPHDGTKVLSAYLDNYDNEIAPSFTYFENELGGRVAIMPTSLCNNRTSSLYNLRRQEMLRNVFNRLAGENGLPVNVKNAPGVWVLAALSKAGDEMLVMVNNLNCDVRAGVKLDIGKNWSSAKAYFLDDDGNEVPLDIKDGVITIEKPLGVMIPEFIILSLP